MKHLLNKSFDVEVKMKAKNNLSFLCLWLKTACKLKVFYLHSFRQEKKTTPRKYFQDQINNPFTTVNCSCN
jgi:hypothetical protein